MSKSTAGWRETFNDPREVIKSDAVGVATTAAELKRMYVEEEMTVAEIAKELGVSNTTAYRFMDEAGIDRRNPSDYHVPQKYCNEEWLREQFVHLERSTGEIADDFGLTSNAILYWVRKFELEDELPIKCDFYLSGISSTRGYPTWTATGKGGPAHMLVHRLVVIAHGADPYEIFGDNNLQVHHRNGFKCDNRPCNLEVIDAKTHGRHHTPDSVKWTDDDLECVVRFMMDPAEFMDGDQAASG